MSAQNHLTSTCYCLYQYHQPQFYLNQESGETITSICYATRIALVIGFTLLLAGALANAKTKATCGFAHRHFLSVGGILCFVHGIVSVAYYVNATASAWEGPYPTVHREVHSTTEATTQVV
jgi:Protein of unknown function (DUF1218)